MGLSNLFQLSEDGLRGSAPLTSMSLEFLFLFICYSFAPRYSKNQKFRWGKHPFSDILIQMLVPPFSIKILRKLSYFVFFTAKSLEFFKTFQNKS